MIPGATSVRAAMEAEIGAGNVVYSANGSTTTGAAVGVAVIGETPYAEGKGDKTDLTVPEASTVMALKAAGLKIVVVLIAGRPMILDPILQYADAVVMAWLPGSEGAGVTDILFGDVTPTGKLPMTWPRTMQQIPINVGDATYDPLYPFGHGLTYSMTTAGAGIGGLLLLAMACAGSPAAPAASCRRRPSQDEPKRAEPDAPFCGKVFRDAEAARRRAVLRAAVGRAAQERRRRGGLRRRGGGVPGRDARRRRLPALLPGRRATTRKRPTRWSATR